MLGAIKLLLPALIPSWNFFDSIGPSPRIEYALLQTSGETPQDWREFRPRPAQLSFPVMLMRLFWNPRWNESLFMASCAERLMDSPSHHSVQEITQHISTELHRNADELPTGHWLQFRLIFISRQNAEVCGEVLFVSMPQRLSA